MNPAPWILNPCAPGACGEEEGDVVRGYSCQEAQRRGPQRGPGINLSLNPET